MTKDKKLQILNRFRIVSITEGISMIVLVFLAMPLKWIFDMPVMVTYVGWIHGALFIAYIFILFPTSRKLRWPFTKAVFALGAAVLPFGPFLFDRKLKKEIKLINELE